MSCPAVYAEYSVSTGTRCRVNKGSIATLPISRPREHQQNHEPLLAFAGILNGTRSRWCVWRWAPWYKRLVPLVKTSKSPADRFICEILESSTIVINPPVCLCVFVVSCVRRHVHSHNDATYDVLDFKALVRIRRRLLELDLEMPNGQVELTLVALDDFLLRRRRGIQRTVSALLGAHIDGLAIH